MAAGLHGGGGGGQRRDDGRGHRRGGRVAESPGRTGGSGVEVDGQRVRARAVGAGPRPRQGQRWDDGRRRRQGGRAVEGGPGRRRWRVAADLRERGDSAGLSEVDKGKYYRRPPRPT
ncbi:hypothetical protein PVAP13_4KG110805 [Panicum virgatum]|uniref:Uncharacterized protein n=1 Tax=Panicum virgatum TaxID=38727 RepID=A0A8T0TS82_PANVG|nr:hypothetical protein PVAP13_4KG110805 [Panicum virgatum]